MAAASSSLSELEAQYRQYDELIASKRAWLKQCGVVTGADYWEALAERHSSLPCIEAISVSPVRVLSYREVEQHANRVAHWGLSVGLRQGDVVALMSENRWEFVTVVLGLAKIGVTAAMINNHLREALLHHALSIANTRHIIATRSTMPAVTHLVDSIRAGPTPQEAEAWQLWLLLDTTDSSVPHELVDGSHSAVKSLAEALAHCSTERPDRALRDRVRPRDPMFYIYTSGTTGKSKAARFSNKRWIGAGVCWSGPSLLGPSDKYYIALPLFHGNAMAVALSPCLFSGACAVIREKFSASNFVSDMRVYGCTAMVYIGEVWRYILWNLKDEQDVSDTPLRKIIGNGLRPDIWDTVVSRFNILRVVEHYGSTEMPGAAVLNWTNKSGSCGYVPPSIRLLREYGDRIIRYNVLDGCIERDPATGFCIECKTGEAGELIMPLPKAKYDGYVDPNATHNKIYRNVFREGDTWWSSGDLLSIDENGFYYFVDRAGDSFRWKGENVSTNEVGELLSSFPSIGEVNVYGVAVPNHDGKAGMASITLSAGQSELDTRAFFAFATEQLPSYARPLFLRIRTQENDKTATLKYKKYSYSVQGFDPSNAELAGDRLYFCDAEAKDYIPLTQQVYQHIVSNHYRL